MAGIEEAETFAEEASIDVAKATPKPLFELLVLSLLLASRIDHELSLRAFASLRRAKLTSVDGLADAEPADVVHALDGDYLRKERTTDLLQTCARQVRDDWSGDLRKLREEAGGDVARATELVEAFKGFGPVGAEIFLREVQVAWEDLSPFYGERVKEAAKARHVPSSDAKLAELGDPARIGAALIRSTFSPTK